MHKIDYMLLDYKQQYLSVLEKWGEKQKRKSEEKKKKARNSTTQVTYIFHVFL